MGEEQFSVKGERLYRSFTRQLWDFVRGQLRRILVTALLEESAQEEIVLQGIHIVSKGRGPNCGLLRRVSSIVEHSAIVDQGTHRPFALVDLRADRLHVVHG